MNDKILDSANKFLKEISKQHKIPTVILMAVNNNEIDVASNLPEEFVEQVIVSAAANIQSIDLLLSKKWNNEPKN